jgi:hypothetical protein
MYLFGCASVSAEERFLKNHTSHFMRILYTPYKFGCDRFLIEGTLLG